MQLRVLGICLLFSLALLSVEAGKKHKKVKKIKKIKIDVDSDSDSSEEEEPKCFVSQCLERNKKLLNATPKSTTTAAPNTTTSTAATTTTPSAKTTPTTTASKVTTAKSSGLVDDCVKQRHVTQQCNHCFTLYTKDRKQPLRGCLDDTTARLKGLGSGCKDNILFPHDGKVYRGKVCSCRGDGCNRPPLSRPSGASAPASALGVLAALLPALLLRL